MGERGVTRMNVSVPHELKKEMDAVKESVNWSAVAAQAFRDKLLELKSQRGATNMDEVIDRLKAAAELEANEEYQAGMEAGRKWAKDSATPKELRRIADYVDSFQQNEWWDVDGHWNAPFGATDYFVFAARPDCKEDRGALGDFWEQALGDDAARRITDADYFHGFGDGAIEVWDQVRDKL